MAFDKHGVDVGQLWQAVRPDGDGLVIRVTGFTNHRGVYAEYLRVHFIVEKDGLTRLGHHKQAGLHGSVSIAAFSIAAFSNGRYRRVKAIYSSICHLTFYVPVSRTTSTTDSVAHPYPTALGEDDYIPTPIKQPVYVSPWQFVHVDPIPHYKVLPISVGASIVITVGE